ncbi:MAG: arsenite methyltransferase [Chitinophagaceae bacterium]
MNTASELKAIVKEKYSEIALQNQSTTSTGCCSCSTTGKDVYHIMHDEYNHLPGYVADADLKLGCGLPTHFAKIKQGDTVVDLGSGAGNDCFVARHEAGEAGTIIGIDFTEAMIEKAKHNAQKLGYNNVQFVLGDIENIPLSNNLANVVISNCVMNLVPNKQQAFAEVYRILKPGGHFSISDIVVTANLPANIKQAAEMYAGCVASAIDKNEYLQIIAAAGFTNITVQQQKPIVVPDEILINYITNAEITNFKAQGNIIFSISVYAEKKKNNCC